MFIVQSFQLLESQSMLLLIRHLYCQSNVWRWDLDFQWEYNFTPYTKENGVALDGVLTIVR